MRRGSVLLVALGGALAWPGPATSQSLLSSGGLGFPLDAVDARSRALGSAGIGLFGSTVLPTDPVSAVDLELPEIGFTVQHAWVDLEGPAEPEASGARFPVIGLAYPFFDVGLLSLTFGTVLDQRWRVELDRQVELADDTVDVTDSFVSDGGVSAVRLGFARRVSSNLAVGVSAGRYTGELRRTFTRTFDTLDVGQIIPPFVRAGAWSYSGTTLSVGARFDPAEVVRLAASVTWSGELTAEPSDDTDGAGADFSVPTEYRVGASGALTPTLDLVVGMNYADWAASDELGGRSIFGWGAGLELDELTLLGRALPLRAGYRRTDLPFPFDEGEPTESVWSGGFGLAFAPGDGSRARVDVTFESGDRAAGSLSESFRRATVSLRISGN